MKNVVRSKICLLVCLAMVGLLFGGIISSAPRVEGNQDLIWTLLGDDPEGDTQIYEGYDFPGGQPWADITKVEVADTQEFIVWRMTLKDLPDTTEGDVIPVWAVRYEFVFRQAQKQDVEFLASIDVQYVAGTPAHITKGDDGAGWGRPQVADHWEVDIGADTVSIWIKRGDIGGPPDGTEINTVWVNTFDGFVVNPPGAGGNTPEPWAWVDHAIDGTKTYLLGAGRNPEITIRRTSIKISVLPEGDNAKDVNPGKRVKYNLVVENTGTQDADISFSITGVPEGWIAEMPQTKTWSKIFNDDFSDGNDNGWKNNGGEWVVENGEYSHKSKEYHYAIVDNVSWSNYEVKGKVLRGSTDQQNKGVGIVFRYVNDSNYWRAVQEENKFRIRGVVNGHWITVEGTEIDYPDIPENTWYLIKISARGDILSAKIWKDGDLEPENWTVTGRSADNPCGSAGFCAIACQARFDNIEVTGLQPVKIPPGQKIETTLSVTAPEYAEEYETAVIIVYASSPGNLVSVTTVTTVKKSGSFGEVPGEEKRKGFISGFELPLIVITMIGVALIISRSRRML